MSNDAMKPITWRQCDCGTFFDSQDKIDDCEANGHGIEELTRLREENARLREALRFLAYAVSPDPKNLEPDWNVLSYEPHFAESMEMARHALGVKLGKPS